MAILEFNYNRAIGQAKQIESVANDMLDVSNKQLQTSIDSITACWNGEASKQFLGHCATMQSDIRTQAKTLQDLAKRIRDVARIIKEAEDRAKELQRSRDTAANGGGGGGGKGF